MSTARVGADYEREVIAMLESHGYECIRSAASKGQWDIHARKVVKQGRTRDIFLALYIQTKCTRSGVNKL